MRVTAGVTIVFSLLLSSLNTDANADACSAANQRWNAAAKTHNSAFATEVRKAFGVDEKYLGDPVSKQECLKWLPIYNASLPDYQELRGLSQALHNSCPTLSFADTNTRLKDQTSSVEAAERRMKNLIKTCEGIIARTDQVAVGPTSAVSPRSAGGPKSADCSMITDKDHPAYGHCDQAKRSLKSARSLNVRKNYPLVAEDEYKRAAEALRNAGDTAGQNDVLKALAALQNEISNPTPEATPAADLSAAQMQANLKTCESLEGLGRQIEGGALEDRSCVDLKVAAVFYLQAARYCLATINNASEDEPMYLKTAQLLRNKDRLEAIAEARTCSRTLQVKKDSGRGNTKTGWPSAAECAAIFERLKPHSINQAWLDDQMARSHCRGDGAPMTLREAVSYATSRARE